jgi:hypothetical protein
MGALWPILRCRGQEARGYRSTEISFLVECRPSRLFQRSIRSRQPPKLLIGNAAWVPLARGGPSANPAYLPIRLDSLLRRVHAPIVKPYPVVDLGTDVRRELNEQLGSKPKFWFRHSDGQRWLFKYARPHTGEHWAEKVAAEIANLMGLPHALVELARVDGAWGAMVCDFTSEGEQGLVHGNELLTGLDPQYPSTDTYHVRAHTLTAIHSVLEDAFVQVPPSLDAPHGFSAFETFVGYLALDALIGNTDRHHENWGILLNSSGPAHAELAPTYDHASSLGRELTDEVRERKYGAHAGAAAVKRYCGKARSALFLVPEARHPSSPVSAFRAAAQLAPRAGQFWLNRLRLCQNALESSVEAVPSEAMSMGARRFCVQLLGTGAQTLLE